MELRFTLEGLCCPVCAAKIETGIQKLNGVGAARVDFNTRRLIMEITSHAEAKGIIAQAETIVKRIEPKVVMKSAAPADAGTADTLEQDEEPATFRQRQLPRIRIGLGTLLFAAGMVFEFAPPLELAVFLLSYLLIGGAIVLRALKNISRGQVFDENFLMSVASIGAFAIGEYPEGVAVMLFYQIGEAFQDLAVNHSRASIAGLMDIRPDFANLKTGDNIQKVNPEDVHTGDFIIVKPGEKIPLDGIVTEGFSALDTSALTGESLPRDVEPGTEVLSGSINRSGLLLIRVTKEFGESTVSKILTLVQNAGSRKAPVENFITKFARYYTPAVVFAAIVLAIIPPLIQGAQSAGPADWAVWIHRALVFLVVSCPCALVISIPLSFFGGIGGASRNGILVKGGNFLDALNAADTIVFDKTGTLTRGVFQVTEIITEKGRTKEQLLYYAASAESNSNHPIALSIQKAYGEKIDPGKILSHEEIAGKGIRVRLEDKTILAGNGQLLESENIDFPHTARPGTLVYIAVDGVCAGYIVIADELKPDSRQAVQDLKAAGIRRIVMLTGDNRGAAEKAAGELGLDQVYAELLPHQKVEQLEILDREKRPKGKLVFVGDGINDAPVLARSDIGIAMGGMGSDAAIEAADIVLMTDEPGKLLTAIRVAKRTHAIVWQNIIFALGVKALILVLGAAGIATMWAAVFGDVGVAIIAILNAARVLRT